MTQVRRITMALFAIMPIAFTSLPAKLPGKIMSTDSAGQSAEVESVQGSALSVNATYGVRVDNANVVATDIETDNGVIHVIDQVVIHLYVLLAGRPPGLFP